MTAMMFDFDDLLNKLADSRKCGMERLAKNKPLYRYTMTDNNSNKPNNAPESEGSATNKQDSSCNRPNNVEAHAYKDENGNICVDYDFPGRNKEDIHVYWNSRRDLTVDADECDAGKYGYYAREHAQVSFHFEHDMDYENSTATYNNGVLTVTVKELDKADEKKPFETPIL